MSVIFVLPTYNEAENLPILIPQLLDIARVRVLVVDDDSPDGTGEVKPGALILGKHHVKHDQVGHARFQRRKCFFRIKHNFDFMSIGL